MSWFTDLFSTRKASAISATPLPVLSPWVDSSHIEKFLMAEALGFELSQLPMDRKLAMTIPAVARGRGLIVGAASQLPLIALNADGPIANQPSFLYRSDTRMSPQERIQHTVDDLIFYGDSLWAVSRGALSDGSAHAPILDAAWVPRGRWSIRNDGHILVDGDTVDDEEVIYFHRGDGLLDVGERTLRGAIGIEESLLSQTRNPIPLTVIQHTAGSDSELEDDEVADLKAAWIAARQSPNGALGYLPAGLEIQTHGQTDPGLFETGRNAHRLDIANHMNLPAVMLDGSLSTSTLTYSTTEGNSNRFYTETMPLYLGVIERALSGDNVVPRGQYVRFDTTQLTTSASSPTGAPEED